MVLPVAPRAVARRRAGTRRRAVRAVDSYRSRHRRACARQGVASGASAAPPVAWSIFRYQRDRHLAPQRTRRSNLPHTRIRWLRLDDVSLHTHRPRTPHRPQTPRKLEKACGSGQKILMLYPDSIYLNANVITLDDYNPRARAFAVRDGKFVVVGTDEQVRALRGAHTDVSDLHGQTVIPGLIDAHNHLLSTGKILRALPLFGAHSLAEVQRKLGERAAATPRGEWIVGRGWDESLLAEGRAPTR